MGIKDMIKRIAGTKPAAITLTSINLKLGSDVHAMGGREVESGVFSLDVPFRNRVGSGLLPQNLKGPDMVISGISVDRPFELVGVEPEPPASVPYLGSATFHLRISAPMQNYSGPITITFLTDSSDNVNIDVKKLVLTRGARSADVEESTGNMMLKKSQIIRRDIQAYKILGYGTDVKGITVNKPFEVVSTEPQVPFKIDRKDSYVVKVYVKCPDFSYAGPMEIGFE